MDYSKLLNKEQIKAVTTVDVPLLISAGAGSGKTRVITYKIAYLIQELHKNPYHILALSFTNKSANEMKNRIEAFIHNKNSGLRINTFHSLCTYILRRELSDSFIIIDEDDKKGLMKDIIKRLDLDKDIYNVSLVNQTISRYKNLNIRYDQKNLNKHKIDTLDMIMDLYKNYEELKQKQGYFDFDDLLIKTIHLFYDNKEILQKYRKKYQYILVDEFQDTNEFQYNLVYLLGYDKKNITIVGDPDQSIYSWRGASIKNFSKFQKDFFNHQKIKLEQNYRSTNNILSGATSVIKYNSSYDEKVLWSRKRSGEKLKVFSGISIDQESEYIIEQIESLIKNGYHYRDIALFCRTNYYYQNLEFQLRECDIPYRIIGGLKFFEKYEIKIIMAYLRFLYNPNDLISLLRIINTPNRGIGKQTIEKIRQISQREGRSFYNILETIEQYDIKKDPINDFVKMIKEFITLKNESDPFHLTAYIINRIDYKGYLEKFPEYEIRHNNIDQFLKDIKGYVHTEQEPSLEGYIYRISLLSEVDDLKEKEDYIHIITIHNAKGLEFKVVFIIGLQEGMFPHYRVLESDDCQNDIEEERRLFYVGLTRAKELVYLTNPQMFSFFGRNKVVEQSRFVREIDPQFCENVY